MRRLLLAALTASATMGFAIADDEKAKPKSVPATPIQPKAPAKADDAKANEPKKDDKPKTRKERLAEISKELNAKRAALIKDINGTTDAAERNKLIPQYMNVGAPFAKQMLDLAKEDVKDEASFLATVAALQNGGQGKVAKDALEFLTDHFASDDRLPNYLALLTAADAGAVEKLAAKTTNKSIKGALLFGLVETAVDNADYPRTGVPLGDDERKAKFAEATAKLTALAAEHGSVEIKNRLGKTVGEAAKKKQFFIDNLTIGKTAPDFECELLDEKKAKISDYRGSVVVVDIWATWCGPCKAMIPHERELVSRLKDKPFKLVSVSADEKKETLTKFLEKEEMPWTHFWNGSKGNMLETYQVRFYPTIYVLDKKGVIRYKHTRGEKMDAAVEELLKESGE
jgi:thiol-disulfide isomerase/thioredoxin